MALVSFLPAKRYDIPHESGEWIELRKPSSRHVREARLARESEGRRSMNDFSAEIVKAFNSGDDDERAVRRAKRLSELQEYSPDGFDRDTLLCASIVRWSYQRPEGGMVPINRDSVGDLDEETARWAVGLVLDLMRPASKEADKSPADAAPSGAV